MLRRLLLIPPLAALALFGWGYANSVADPVIRRADLALPGWPEHTAPLEVALISDIHVQGPDMPPERVARIVAQVNAQHPDLILLAGDYVGDRQLSTRAYGDAEIAAALGKFSAPLGVYAVLGNHDHWRDGAAMRRALADAGIHVLANEAARAGVLTLVGVDDDYSRHARLAPAVRAADALPGPVLVLTHSPDIVPALPPRFTAVLAGHTHCGQVVLPLVGTLVHVSRYGDRYGCGVIREGSRTVVVGAGWGTSGQPLRFGAPPDWWMLRVGPAQAPARR